MTADLHERPGHGGPGLLDRLNRRWHKVALYVFLVVVLAHWAEHLLQALQIYVLGWARSEAGGGLGLIWPRLVTSEWLHYAYAFVMLAGFIILRHGFVGRSRTWWMAALWIQVWHHFEHFILLVQAMTGLNLGGMAQPTSLVQLVIPRVELHLFYNSVVFVPMVMAMVYHRWPKADERRLMTCACATALSRS